MNKLLLAACVLLAAGMGRAAAQSASFTFDKSADFSKYRTYKWVTIKNAQQLDELTSDQLIGTIEVQLAKKGLTKTQSDHADLFIGYQVARGDQKNGAKTDAGLAASSGIGGNTGSTTVTSNVHSGLLVLDMYEPTNEKLVWRGVVSHSIDADAKPYRKQKHMDRAVEKLLKNYPPNNKS